MTHLLFAWLFWNPNPIAFTLPFIERPIAWYGICFVTGLFLGYFILVSMFKKKLEKVGHLCPKDVKKWPLLIEQLQTGVSPHSQLIFKELNQKEKKLLTQSKLSLPMKEKIVSLFNQHPADKPLEDLYPEALYTFSERAHSLVDLLLWFVIGGILIGARLGHIFFYEWPYFQQNPIKIFYIWEGGLASHGGAIGVILAVIIYQQVIKTRVPNWNVIALIDMISVPTALTAFWIRIGNFINQELFGTESTLPWAVIFGNPGQGFAVVPRHPAQLYEALCYLATFCFLYTLWWKKQQHLRTGVISGLFFILVFGSRFIVEFAKVHLSKLINESFLHMGQYLSLPFIALGIFLLFYSRNKKALTALSDHGVYSSKNPSP